MEMGVYSKCAPLNPELEEIRNKVLSNSSNRTNEATLQLIRKTSRIHAGFLFEAPDILQQLCLFISETPSKISDSGWEKFGYHLGLKLPVLKCISHNNFNKEDPTYNTLLAYVQLENATIGKIIEALEEMGRLDVISRISEPIHDLADLFFQVHGNANNAVSTEDTTSDYESLPTEGDMTNSLDNFSSSSREIIKPEVIPPAPFIFQNIRADPEITSRKIQQALNHPSNSTEHFPVTSIANNDRQIFQALPVVSLDNSRRSNEALQTRDATQTPNNKNKQQEKSSKKKRYGKVIMLTFAADGEKIARTVCERLRRKRADYPSLGVLMLSEQLQHVNKDPERFITGAFHQVDYVCPIVTEGYLKSVTKKNIPSYTNMHVDAKYAQFIFTLMNTYYVNNGCLNDKIRCIIPDNLLSSLQHNLLMAGPVLSAWVKFSEVEELALRLLKSKS